MTAIHKAYGFFRENAGYVVGQNAMGALGLARAEQALEDDDSLAVEWGPDPYIDLSWADELTLQRIEDGYYECKACVIMKRVSRHTRECVASLSGIVSTFDAHDTYPRVVEAELALEAVS